MILRPLNVLYQRGRSYVIVFVLFIYLFLVFVAFDRCVIRRDTFIFRRILEYYSRRVSFIDRLVLEMSLVLQDRNKSIQGFVRRAIWKKGCFAIANVFIFIAWKQRLRFYTRSVIPRDVKERERETEVGRRRATGNEIPSVRASRTFRSEIAQKSDKTNATNLTAFEQLIRSI